MSGREHQIRELIHQGEGLTTEFKTSWSQITRDVYETVCAFLNRRGGTILLGINDAGEVTGVKIAALAQIKKDFVTAINNPQKINPPAYLSVEEVVLSGKMILRIYVPESSQVHRCNGRIYDRNEDGDFDITDHTRMVADLYHRKQATYSENKIYPFAALSDLRSDLIDRCRRLAGAWNKDHPWLNMDDMELIKSAQLYQTDHETGNCGVTLAGILLLGQDCVILSAVPYHRTDMILRKVNLDRYDDRDFVDTNLIESHDRIMAFVRKHLPDTFYLEGIQRISIREAIFREVASNILIHREYRNAFPAKFIIEYGQVRTENSNKPHGFGVLNPDTFTPYPKNPVICKFFRQIGWVDELGSGMRKMMKYGKAYGGANPEMIEGDVFRIMVKVPEFGGAENSAIRLSLEAHDEAHDEANISLTEVQQRIVEGCLEMVQSTSSLLDLLGYESRTGNFKKALSHLLKLGLVEQVLPNTPRSKKQQYRTTAKGKQVLDLQR